MMTTHESIHVSGFQIIFILQTKVKRIRNQTLEPLGLYSMFIRSITSINVLATCGWF